ncbi:MAG: hybrid sensor histidine kinase/response regulator [Polyangiales bacterium]
MGQGDGGHTPPDGVIGAILRAADAAGLGVCVSTTDGDTVENVWVSDAACTIHGRPREELLRRSVLENVPPDALPRVREQSLRRQRGDDSPTRFETEILHPDGRRIQIAVGVTYVELDGRKVAVTIFEDISARSRASSELAASEARFRALVEAAPHGIAIVRDGLMVYANPYLVKLMGYDLPSEMVGKTFEDVLFEPDAALARARAADIIAGRALPAAEYRFRKRDGGTVIAEVTSFLGHWDGTPALITIGRDVTERAALEAQLARADRLAALGTLSAGVAHEINNPLTFLTLGIAALEPILQEAQLDDARRARARALFDEIRRGAERVAAIVRDLRAFARFEDEERGPVDLGKVLASAERIAAHEVRAHGKFLVDVPELPSVLGSSGKLEQVFVNLLVNAAQALPETGGTVELRARVAKLGGGEKAVVEVRDDGPGIPPELLGRVFDPFFTTKPPGVGTGLGLSISHAIVTRIGGEITIDSAPGKGTTVRVSLPTSGAPVESSPNGPKSRRSRRRARVLVVDDEPALALTLRCVLERDHDVVTADGGRAALALLEKGDFDLVLCDLAMPGLSGDAVYERTAAARPELAARFVFMTGGAFTARLQGFLDRVPNPRLQKPFPISALEDLIGTVTHEYAPESRR